MMAEEQRRLLAVALAPGVFSRFPPLLWRSAFDVSAPQDPEVAVQAIANTRYDLIICSFSLPGMEFRDFLDEVRGYGRPCRSTPLLAVADPTELSQALPFIGKGLNRLVSSGAPDLELERAAVELLNIAPRAEVRLEVDLNATVGDRHRRIIAQTLNVSRNGMLIADPGHLEVGGRVDFRFPIPGSRHEIAGSGKVVRVDVRRGGVGVHFLSFDVDGQELLGEFIDQQLQA